MIGKEEVVHFDNDYINEVWKVDDCIEDTPVLGCWGNLFTDKFEYCLVVGSAGTWQGRREIIPQLLDTDLDTFLDKISSDIDGFDFKFYKNKVEFAGSHHDATNYYTCIPFNWDMIKKEYFVKLVEDKGLRYAFDEYLYNYVSESKRWYNATKDDYIDYLSNGVYSVWSLEFLPIGNDDFLKKFKIEL